MFRKILVAHDGSDGARKAFDRAVGLVSSLQAELHMISVEEHLPRHAETIDEVREEKEVEDTYFGRLAAQSKQRAALRGVNLECRIKPGNEVETIVSFAREGQFDLLVVGFMGHSRIFGRIWGGTSQKLDEDSPLFSFGREIIVSLSETGMSQRRRARILEILCDLARPAELGHLDDLLDDPVEAVRWKAVELFLAKGNTRQYRRAFRVGIELLDSPDSRLRAECEELLLGHFDSGHELIEETIKRRRIKGESEGNFQPREPTLAILLRIYRKGSELNDGPEL